MKTKTLTFDHLTYQTGHNSTQTDFAPIPEVAQALSGMGPVGAFPITDWIVEVAPYAENVAVFTISSDKGVPFVRCYASYITDAAKATATSQRILWELKEQAKRLEIIPAAGLFFGRLPELDGPFLLVVFMPTLLEVGAGLAMLGDAERCIYWHLHQFYGE